MGWAAGFNAGAEISNSRARRELAAAQEERAKLEFEQRKQQWDRDSQDRAKLAQFQEEFTNRLGNDLDTDGTNQYLSQFGVQPRPQVTPTYAPGVPTYMAPGEAPSAPAEPAQQGIAIGRQRLDGDTIAQLKSMAQFAKTPQDVAALNKAYADARRNQVQGAVTNAILQAPQEQLQAIAQQYSDFGGTPGKMTVDKDGYTTVTLDGGDPIKMNRYQLAQFVNGMYKLKQGDATGHQDISVINEQLSKAMQTHNAGINDAARTNNTAANGREVSRHNAATEATQAAAQRATEGYYRERTASERMGAAQYVKDEATGETYAVVPTMGKNGLTMQKVSIGKGLKLEGRGAGTPSAPKKAAPEGELYTDPSTGQAMAADGLGGWIPLDRSGNPAGVFPSSRSSFLKQSGVPDSIAPSLKWNATGTAVGWDNKAYDVRDPADMKALVKDWNSKAQLSKQVEEANKSRVNPPGAIYTSEQAAAQSSGAPSIYASPEEWAAYRKRMGLGLQR